MRICIYGAGASGGHFAVRLAAAGHAVNVVARGENMTAIRQRGLRLLSGEEDVVAPVAASDDPADFGEQDLVIVTVKATALASVAAGLAPLIGAGTHVLFTQNGIPWWYPVGLAAGAPALPALESFALSRPFLESVPAERVLAGLIYSANEMHAPGVVANASPGSNRLDLGPVASRADNEVEAERIREILRVAQIASHPVDDIRRGVWRKLLFNMSGSVVALATGNKSSISRDDEALGAVYLNLVREGLAIAAAHGYPMHDEMVPEQMRDRLLDHKPSLLQDYEQRRPMEIAEIVLAPLAFADAAGVPAPTLETVAAIVSRLARDRGLFG